MLVRSKHAVGMTKKAWPVRSFDGSGWRALDGSGAADHQPARAVAFNERAPGLQVKSPPMHVLVPHLRRIGLDGIADQLAQAHQLGS